MNLLNMILTPLFSTLIGGVVGFLINQCISMHKNKKEAEKQHQEEIKGLYEEIQTLKESSRAMLHDTILKKCNQLLMIGSVTPEEIDELEYLYKPYRDLNGNHRAEKAYNMVLDLPRVKKHEEE